ncbi:MAG TPA: hypothetical protein VND45_09955 [Thermoanaerobaculia bacterium]|jgi:hypothetical protein|nr:hypothetical protein [Thermoanaerobaculia bacterium]
MIDFTPEAKQKFDDYLHRMRGALLGRRAVEPDEVEQNVVEHVETALAGVPSPVGQERLAEVLAQLGPPERWLPEDERPSWRRVVQRFMTGPDDWRLAYVSLGLMLLMIVTLPIGGILLVIPAFLVSRAYVELLGARGEELGARRWLVLPPIVLVMVIVSVAALVGVTGPIAAIGLDEGGLRAVGFRGDTQWERVRIETGFIALTAGSWWIVLSGIFAMLMRPFRALFLPLTANLRRPHALALTLAGAIVAALGAVLLFVL